MKRSQPRKLMARTSQAEVTTSTTVLKGPFFSKEEKGWRVKGQKEGQRRAVAGSEVVWEVVREVDGALRPG